MLIIAGFLFSLNGCGYKADPYYQKEAPQSDENIEFILEKKKFVKDNNESCN